MTRRSNPGDPEWLLLELRQLLDNFESKLTTDDLRPRVLALIPAVHALRDLGSSLISRAEADSAADRILLYFRKYYQQIIRGDELLVVAGISEWARRVRELRVQLGWRILSGGTIQDMIAEGDIVKDPFGEDLTAMLPDDYILFRLDQDREAAHRWNVANSIRKSKDAVQDKVLLYLRENVGRVVTGEELRYIAKDATEWARRVRELRTEEGWPVVTKNTGRPDLAVGEYLLEADRQSPAHDRDIPDPIRVAVLERDGFHCTKCHWSTINAGREILDNSWRLHHVEHHVAGGENTVENLVTLCNVHHDEVHRH